MMLNPSFELCPLIMPKFVIGLHHQRKLQQITTPPCHTKLAGQGLVEFALTLPILILILVGVLDLGRLSFAAMTVTNAAREGARYGAANPGNDSGITARARNEAYGSIIAPSSLVVDLSNKFPSSCALGNPIRVTVKYNFQPITTYLFGGGTIQLSASDEMPIFGTCP